MGFEDAIDLLETIFFRTEFAGMTWLFHIILILGTLLIITRVWKDWATLTLPVMVGWKYFGVNISYVFFTIATIMFVIDVMSIKVLSGALSGIGDAISHYTGNISRSTRAKRSLKRMEIKDAEKELISKYNLENINRKTKANWEKAIMNEKDLEGDLIRLPTKGEKESKGFDEKRINAEKRILSLKKEEERKRRRQMKKDQREWTKKQEEVRRQKLKDRDSYEKTKKEQRDTARKDREKLHKQIIDSAKIRANIKNISYEKPDERYWSKGKKRGNWKLE